MAPSATTTRVASASRSADTRIRLSAEGDVGNEAMKGLPGVRRLSAMRLPRRGPGKGHGVRVTGSGLGWAPASTRRTQVAEPDGRDTTGGPQQM
ncbi:hypothetical protein Scel_72590 [Streptomyces cellostaticus]|nr:hypothetical protein Scel_72590 [Streptomyces cellostaticus]